MIINVLLAPPILPRSRVGTFIFNTNINNNLEYSYKLHNNHGQMSGYRQYVHIVGVSFTTIMRHPVDRSISMVRACVRGQQRLMEHSAPTLTRRRGRKYSSSVVGCPLRRALKASSASASVCMMPSLGGTVQWTARRCRRRRKSERKGTSS